MYRCTVHSITTPENALITSVNGSHQSGKSNDNEICFYSLRIPFKNFPQGLEKIYKNLIGICFYNGPLKEIRQSDLKSYKKLIFLQIAETKIEVLEDGLFDFNPNLEYVAFNKNKIFHIDLRVFDHLSKLGTLYLDNNKCIDRKVKKDRSVVLDIIKDTKILCSDQEFRDFHEKVGELEKKSINLNSLTFPIFELKLESLQNELKTSNSSNSSSLNERLQNLLNFKNEFNTQVCSKYNQLKEFRTSTNENFIALNTLVTDSQTSITENIGKIYAKLELQGKILDQLNTQTSEKLQIMKKELEVTTTNILNSVNERITNFEQQIAEKVNDLDAKLEEIAKELKKVIKLL